MESWSEHARADFCETVALYFRPALVHAYLTILSTFKNLYKKESYTETMCKHWGTENGYCGKGAQPGTVFCKKHESASPWLLEPRTR